MDFGDSRGPSLNAERTPTDAKRPVGVISLIGGYEGTPSRDHFSGRGRNGKATGGELIVEDYYGSHEVKLPAGQLVLYPATSLHTVTPITRGARVASFFWPQSMIRDAHARSMIFDLDTAIQGLIERLGRNDPEVVKLSGLDVFAHAIGNCRGAAAASCCRGGATGSRWRDHADAACRCATGYPSRAVAAARCADASCASRYCAGSCAISRGWPAA